MKYIVFLLLCYHIHVTQAQNNWSLYNDDVHKARHLSSTTDFAGNLYFGTFMGLIKHEGNSWQKFNSDNISIGSSNFWVINGLRVDKNGILWAATADGLMKNLCGRLKSDYRYSNSVVYNNFPWPDNPNEKQIKSVEIAAQKVLDTRHKFPNSSLADLYDTLTMPPSLIKAHNELDKAVDLAYRPQPFTSEANRMEFLFELYEKYTADLFTKEKPKKTKKTKA